VHDIPFDLINQQVGMKLSKAILSPNNPRCKVGFARTRCLTLPDADNKKWWILVHHFLRASLFYPPKEGRPVQVGYS
jgi:hypothetical protein